jgi:hypothetical protein
MSSAGSSGESSCRRCGARSARLRPGREGRPTLVTHHLEELPGTTTHTLLLTGGRVVAAGPAGEIVTTGNVSAALGHPISVRHDEGRWTARAAVRPAV